MLAPYLIGKRGRGAWTGSGGDGDGGFVDPPVVTTTSTGDTTVKGQVKPGSFGKFVFPLATIAAGRQYTFRYTPHFQQLAQQGKLAMVGFGLKNSNDFHIVGLRGDGSTGLHKYIVDGTPPNGWNKDTGHTTSDGGASANGTQAGPNYIRLVVSADGATYKFQTSPDNITYTDEYTGQTPTPFSNVSGVATFGIALWFNNADAGPFSIVIDQFADAVAGDPNFASVSLLLGFEGTDGATSTTDESPSPKTVTFNGNAQIDNAQFKFGATSLALDGTGDYLDCGTSSDLYLSGDFTLEAFIRIVKSTNYIMTRFNATGSQQSLACLHNAGKLAAFYSTTGSSSSTLTGVTTLTAGVWHHACWERSGTTLRIYLNGIMENKATVSGALFNNSSTPFLIGRRPDGTGSDFQGWIDEVRITKGVARYASDGGFTVPAAAFPRA